MRCLICLFISRRQQATIKSKTGFIARAARHILFIIQTDSCITAPSIVISSTIFLFTIHKFKNSLCNNFAVGKVLLFIRGLLPILYLGFRFLVIRTFHLIYSFLGIRKPPFYGRLNCYNNLELRSCISLNNCINFFSASTAFAGTFSMNLPLTLYGSKIFLSSFISSV